MTHSARFVISQTIVVALRAAIGQGLPSDAVVHDNPPEPSVLSDGGRIVFLKDEGDQLVSQEGQIPCRRFAFTLGVICRTGLDESRSDADELYEAAQAVARGATPAIAAAGVRRVQVPREVSVAFDLEGIDAGGALILGTFEIDYEKPRAT